MILQKFGEKILYGFGLGMATSFWFVGRQRFDFQSGKQESNKPAHLNSSMIKQKQQPNHT